MSSTETTGATGESSDDAPPKWHFWKKAKKPVADKPKYPPLPYWKLFEYSTPFERGMLFVSLLAAVAHGAILPLLTVLFGDVVDEFRNIFLDPSDPDFVPQTEISESLTDVTKNFLILSFVSFAVSFVQLSLALLFANRVGNEMRRRFFETLLRQDCDFYDDSEAGALTNLVVNDINLIQAGIGDKLATATQYVSTFIIGIIIGFVYGWKLTLVILAVTPILLIAGAVFGNASADATGDGLGSYGEAGAVATEVLSLVRTVTAFGGQEEEARRYDRTLQQAYKASSKAAIASGLGLGFAMGFILSTYALAFWFGARLVRDEEISAGDVLLTFFAISLGASSLGTAGPSFKSFGVARAAAPRVFEIIERKSPIDPLDYVGIIPTEPVHGNIKFENVDFNYKKRITEEGDSELVLEKFNLDIPAGSSEAFVGKSGSGKSTVARLIERLYDPLSGRILLDGVDIRELNVRWLRSQIGVVSQMPSLFMLSIRENIALGAGVEFTTDPKTGEAMAKRREVSEEEIIAAAKMANAHTFITRLPEGYDTMLGERGAMLSGGQKQRVCIARALVRNPKILLLDESTASLDTASEKIVQDALEKASAGRTTITIAHRLSTVRNADNISCIQNGIVLERGPHSDLVHRDGGFYRGLFELQMVEKAKLDEEKSDGEDEEQDADAPLPPAKSHDISVTKTGQDSTSHALIGALPDEEDEPVIDKGVFLRTMKMNGSEWVYMVMGSLGAVVAGVIWPVAAILLVELITIMLDGNDSDEILKWSLSFLALGTAAFLGNGLQHGVLGIAGEKLTRKLRSLAFRALLKQEIGYFDLKENSVGALSGRLSTDAGAVRGLTGDIFGVGINVVSSIGCGLIIAFVNCWRVTLVVLAIIPGVALGGYFEMQASAGFDAGARKDFATANALASEAVDNVGTVRSIGVEDSFANRYTKMIGTTVRSKNKKAILTGAAFGFSEFSQILIWYATFKAGGDFVEAGQCTFTEMLLSSMAILFGAITLGNVAVFAPDLGASRIGATHIYRLLDRVSSIDPTDSDGEQMEKCHGDIAAQKVVFEYPRRPDVPVLRGLSIEIANAKTLALVGTSGHGKSTIIALLERFYAIRSGTISVDGADISTVNVRSLRTHIGLVSQEPELFNRSVFDNIAYGVPHGDGTPISMEDVVEAAKQANAHEFIEALPEGYHTMVGARGEALSGGQRQRVAIARSLIRRPPILLLDEATSALDSSSERIVQDALDKAAAGRTTVVVAHRLSTIKNADVIAVVRRGRIAESGTHDVLLRKNGHYADLIQHQLTEV